MEKDDYGFTEVERNKIARLTDSDWRHINGPEKGKPYLTFDGKIYHITYVDGTMVVDHKVPASWGWALLGVPVNRIVDVPVAMCWRLHGEPCQVRSHTHGGPGYEKRKK